MAGTIKIGSPSTFSAVFVAGLGNTRAMIDTDGTLSGQADYLPYGKIFWENGVNYWNNRYLWTGEVYVGRTSGTGTPEENVKRRDKNHHMNKKGFGEAVLDKSSLNPDAIRGQEQYMIDLHGGAKSQGGTSGNAINGVSPKNPKKLQYDAARRKEFGN